MKYELVHFRCDICRAEDSMAPDQGLPPGWIQLDLEVLKNGHLTKKRMHFCKNHETAFMDWFSKEKGIAEGNFPRPISCKENT